MLLRLTWLIFPGATKLTAQAAALGITGITGLEMLVAQAKYAAEIFLDQEIPDARIDEIYRNLADKDKD